MNFVGGRLSTKNGSTTSVLGKNSAHSLARGRMSPDARTRALEAPEGSAARRTPASGTVEPGPSMTVDQAKALLQREGLSVKRKEKGKRRKKEKRSGKDGRGKKEKRGKKKRRRRDGSDSGDSSSDDSSDSGSSYDDRRGRKKKEKCLLQI